MAVGKGRAIGIVWFNGQKADCAYSKVPGAHTELLGRELCL